MNSAPQPAKPSTPGLKVTFGAVPGDQRTIEFKDTFHIGRTDECEVCVPNSFVSRRHAEVLCEDGSWWVVDLGSSNGIYVGDQRFKRISVGQRLTIKLGIEGPQIAFEVVRPPDQKPADPPSDTVIARYVDRYFGKTVNGAPVGEHTMFIRQAYAKVQTRQNRRYGILIAALGVAALAIGSFAVYENLQLRRQRALAEELFYSMKSLDLDIANVERLMADTNNPQGAEMIQRYEGRRKEMEKNYDKFLANLNIYNAKMTDEDRLILRVARIFGECELDMPADFRAEVKKYIQYWQSSGRYKRAVDAAKNNGYTSVISREFLAQGLPPQFFYLAMQESDFDAYISGPMTRKGIAKGMWQFIPETAVKYGLKVGPLADLRRPDPGDERHHWELETKAAAHYIKDLYSTDAQASGLLVMACYNWGEVQVLPLVQSMPSNPKERNFWQLLAKHRAQIPKETYDYVFYIVSAAVIGENPRMFGFDFDNPLAELESK